MPEPGPVFLDPRLFTGSLPFAWRSLSRQPARALLGLAGMAVVGALLFDMLMLSRGLLLSFQRYLGPDAASIHEKGLAPDVEVETPDVDFGTEPPTTDATLQKALEFFSQPQRKAA